MATTVLPAPLFQDESPPPRSFSPLPLPSRPSMEASSMKSRKSLLDIFVSARRPTPAPSGSKLKQSSQPPENAVAIADKAHPMDQSDRPNKSPANQKADAVEPAGKTPPQRPRSKSRTILRAISTKFRSRSPISPTSPPPFNTSLQAKQNREAALRERGLLPPLQPKDLSRLEAERDRHTPIVPLDQKSVNDVGEPSAADIIKREWEAKNKAPITATTPPPPESTATDERDRLRSFRFGSPSPIPGEQPAQAHELTPLKEDQTPLPSPLSDAAAAADPLAQTHELESVNVKESQASLPSPLSEDHVEQLARAPILEPIKEDQSPLPSPLSDDAVAPPPVPEKDLQLTTSSSPPPPPLPSPPVAAVDTTTAAEHIRSDPSHGPPPASPLPTPPPTPSEPTHQHTLLIPPSPPSPAVKPPSLSSHPPERDDVASSLSRSGHKHSVSSSSAPPAPVISLTPPRVDELATEVQRDDVGSELNSSGLNRSGSQKSSSSIPPAPVTPLAQPGTDAAEEPAAEAQRDDAELSLGHIRSGSQKSSSSVLPLVPVISLTPLRRDSTEEPTSEAQQGKAGHNRSGSQKSSSSAAAPLPAPVTSSLTEPRADLTEEPITSEVQRDGVEVSPSGVHSRSGSQKSLPPISSTQLCADPTEEPITTEVPREHTRSASEKSLPTPPLAPVIPLTTQSRADATTEEPTATEVQREHTRSVSQKSLPPPPPAPVTPPRVDSTKELATGIQRDDVGSLLSSYSGHNRTGSQKSSSSVPLTPVISLTPPRSDSTDEQPPSSSVVSLPHRRSESLTKMPSISETVSSIMTPSLETSSRTTTTASTINTIESQGSAGPSVPKGKIGLLKVKAPEHLTNIPMIIESPVEDTFVAEPEDTKPGEIPLPLSPVSEGHGQSLVVPTLMTRRGRGFTDPGKQEKRKSFNPFRRTIVAEPDESGAAAAAAAAGGSSPPKKLSVVTSFGNLRRVASNFTRPRSTYAPSVAPSGMSSGAKTYDASHLPPSPTLPSRFNLSPGAGSGVGGKTSMEVPVPMRRGVQPTWHSRGSILMEANAIEDDETRRMTELAFLN